MSTSSKSKPTSMETTLVIPTTVLIAAEATEEEEAEA
jgi:hypothetical protein